LSPVELTRARMVSPAPRAGVSPPRARLTGFFDSTRIFGGCEPWSIHSAGSANSSPSLSTPTTRKTVTGGRPVASDNRLRREAIRPSSAILRRIFFSSTRSAPLTPNARAISRLPVLASAVLRNSRICSGDGKPRDRAIYSAALLAAFLAGFFLAAFFLAGFFFALLPALAAISSTACSMVTSSGFTSLGSVALILPYFT
jgi:hypothetical protein